MLIVTFVNYYLQHNLSPAKEYSAEIKRLNIQTQTTEYQHLQDLYKVKLKQYTIAEETKPLRMHFRHIQCANHMKYQHK